MDSLATPNSKRGAEFLDVDGDSMQIHAVNGLGCFGIKFANTYREFRNTDAPVMALAILEAAGVEAADPMNSDNDLFADNVGDKYAVLWLKKFIEQQTTKALKAAAEKELTRRRDGLAQHLLGECSVTPYRHASESLQVAIDMIIQLQDEVTK